MNRFCGNCFNESLNDQKICSICGFDDKSNWDKAPHGLPAGTILNGRYIIGRVLGQGGFGITYTARDHQTGQLVAVKEFFPDSMATRSERTSVIPFSGDRGEGFVYGKECFLREAQTMAEFIGNANIVRVYSYFEENETAYFVMEYVDGQSLQEYLKSKGGAISLEEALEILYPVMDALSVVHEKGIIHRDIAPDNIYISKSGEVKLLDFGAARYSLGNVSRSLDVILKHGFAPREQYKRRGRQGPYTDVYSMAATLYYAITGNRPDDALERQDEDDMPLPSSLGAKISEAQEDVLLKAMEVDYEKRFQTMAQFRNALKRAKPLQAETKKPPAEKPKTSEPKKPQPVKKKKPLWLIPAAAALVCILSAVFAMGGEESPAMSVETTLPPVTEQTVPTVTPDPIPETVPLTDEEKAYNEAVDLFYQGEYGKAAIAFGKLGDFRDAKNVSRQIWNALILDKTIGTGNFHTVAVKNDGTVLTAGLRNAVSSSSNGNVKEWTDIVSVTAGDRHTVGLKADGTVLATGLNTSGQCDVSQWTDIIDIVAGESYTAGLKLDGTVVYAGSIPNAEVIDSWDNIVSIAGERIHLGGLRADGSALFTEHPNLIKQNIIGLAVIANGNIITIEEDGSVSLSNGATNKGDFVSVFGGGHITLALQCNGTVIYDGPLDSDSEVTSLEDWDDLKGTDIVAFDASYAHAVILKKDGTISAYGDNKERRCDVKSWKDIRLPKDRDALLAQINPQYITSSGQPSTYIAENILMSVTDRLTNSESEFLNTGIPRQNIRSLTFLNTTKGAPAKSKDVSASGNGKVLAWSNYSDDLYDVYIAAESGITAPENCYRLFAHMKNLRTIDFGNSFNTSNVTSMEEMFYNSGLTSLDVSCFDTRNVTNMDGMFRTCILKTLDLSRFDTSKVESMEKMFSHCLQLESLKCSEWDTSKLKSTFRMFEECWNLNNLVLPAFNPFTISRMDYMFYECRKLENLEIGKFDASRATKVDMFDNCPAEKPDWYPWK